MAQPEIPTGPVHPDPSEQPVARTTAAESRRLQRDRKLAELAARADQRAAERGAEPSDAETSTDDSAIADGPEVISPGTLGDVPPDEPDPRRRRGPSMSEVIADDDTGRHNRRFTDLFADFEVGNGQYYVTVERVEPRSWEGVPTRGELPEIWKPMSWENFQETYGGSKYELIVYIQKDAHTKPKRCSKPITVNVPHLDPVIDIETRFGKTESEAMAASQIPGRGRATNPDARMFETQKEFEEKAEDRRERQEKEREAREQRLVEKAQREQQEKGDAALRLASQQLAERGAEVKELRETIEKLREDFTKANNNGGVKDAVEMAKVMRPAPEEAAALRNLQEKLTDQHAKEIQRLTERNADEIKRLTERHQDELRGLREQHTNELKRLDERNAASEKTAAERVAAADTRATERIAAVEARTTKQVEDSKERIKEVETRMEKAVAEAKLDSDRRANDIQNRHNERVADIERQHKREIESIRERWELQVGSEKGSWQSRLDLKDAEIARLKEELDRVREEARKPLAERLTEAAAVAEAIGYTKDGGGGEEPKDWKQMGLEIIGNVAGQFPEILRAAGDTFAKARQQPTAQQVTQYAARPPQQMVAVQQAPALPGRRRGGFATEDGPDYEGPKGTRPPIYPQAAPPQTPVQQPIMQPIMPPQAPMVQQPMQPIMQPATPVEAMPAPVQETPPAPAPSIPAPSMPPPTAPSVPPVAATAEAVDGQILQLRPLFETAYSQNAKPEELANYCMQNFGKDNVATVLTMGMTPERFLVAMSNGGFATSRLCRRDGQKFLRETFNVLKSMVASA